MTPHDSTSAGVLLALLLVCPLAWASQPIGPGGQDGGRSIVLAPGESRRIPETSLTLAFEMVVEDSRCPTGVTCIREGDAIVRLRIEKPAAPSSTLTLHTGGPGPREAAVDHIIVRLVGVKPYPAGNSKPRADEYRVTLLIQQK